MIRRLWAASIWAPDAIPIGEWKYRHLERVWLPIYDVLAIWAGVDAVLFGSRLLYRLFDQNVVDLVGALFAVVGVMCLLGVVFPRLWAVEVVGKLILVGMVTAYAFAIVLYLPPAQSEPPNFFVMRILSLALPLALFRLTVLGQEWKEHRTGASA